MTRLYFHLPSFFNLVYFQHLREVILPPIQNIMGTYNQITILILCQVSSRLVTLLKFIYSST
jgi:hypothetical protein